MDLFWAGIKDFSKWLVLTHIGRVALSAILLFLGAILINFDLTSIVFYAGLCLFFTQVSILFFFMIINLINDTFGTNL